MALLGDGVEPERGGAWPGAVRSAVGGECVCVCGRAVGELGLKDFLSDHGDCL